MSVTGSTLTPSERPLLQTFEMYRTTQSMHGKGDVSSLVSLILFLTLVLGGGLLIGALTPPDAWYERLTKPAFDPPGWVFAPVWTTLYVLIAIAGWRIWQRAPQSLGMRLWWAQLALNFLWSPVFFGAHQIIWALAIVLLLLAMTLAFIATIRHRDRTAAWLFIPYAAWVAFAALLNGSILALN